MVVAEIIAIRGVVSLAKQLHQQNEAQEGNERDDCTLATCASTYAAITQNDEGQSLQAQLHKLNKNDGRRRSSVSVVPSRGVPSEPEDDSASVVSALTAPTSALHCSFRGRNLLEQEQEEDCASVVSALTTPSSLQCSFRPENSFRSEDTSEVGDMVALDLSSANDVYEMHRRVRDKGSEVDDLEVAIQAAIVARQFMIPPPRRRTRIGIQRPRHAPGLFQTRVQTFSRNVHTIAQKAARPEPTLKEFVQARADTFGRNLETLALMAIPCRRKRSTTGRLTTTPDQNQTKNEKLEAMHKNTP